MKKVTISERGKEVVEYTNINGQVIQKDVQDDVGYMSTAYIYDNFERLKYVVQPQSFATASNFVENDNYFQAGVFGYVYDKRGQVAASHVPSGDWTYHVYDKASRKVLEQTALQKQLGNRWRFMKYDVLGRLAQMGELVNANNQANLQIAFDAVSNPYEVWNGSDYSSQSFPIANSEAELRTVNYYDQYGSWLPSGMAFDGGNTFQANFGNATGLSTGARIRNGFDNGWLASVSYYDSKGRAVQSFTQNLYNQTERADVQYDFVGQAAKIRAVHKKSDGTNIVEVTETEFDNLVRKTALFCLSEAIKCKQGHCGNF